MHRSAKRSGAVLAALVLAATVCGGDDVLVAASTPVSSAVTAPSVGAGELDPSVPVRYAHSILASQWDPHRSVSQAAETPSLVLVYDRLLGLQADSTVEPQLASAWEFSDDGLELTMQLRDDVDFHDGEHFDADVAVANLERAKGDESTVAAQLTNVNVVADGPAELRLVLERPDPTILLTLATTTGAMISPAALNSPSLQQSPAGSGPFTLETATTERHVFAAHPGYWDDELFVPERVEIITVPDDAARLNLLTTGGADMATLAPDIWSQALELAETDEYDLYTYSGALQQVLYLNAATPPLDDADVRRAINLAIDREAISEALNGGCIADSQVFPAGYPGHVAGLEYEYDPEEARRILDDAGVGELTLEVLQSNAEPARTIATVVQAMLAEIGVTINVQPIEPAQIRPTYIEGGYDGMVHSLSVPLPDSSALLAVHAGGPLDIGGAGEALVAVGSAAQSMELGSAERAEAYEEIAEQLFAQPTHAIVCNRVVAYLARANMVGLDQLPFTQITQSADIRGVGFVTA